MFLNILKLISFMICYKDYLNFPAKPRDLFSYCQHFHIFPLENKLRFETPCIEPFLKQDFKLILIIHKCVYSVKDSFNYNKF